MDEQRHVLRRHTASLKQLHAGHQMLLPGGQLLRVYMVDAQVVLNRPEFSGPQPGRRVPAEAPVVPVLPLPVHRRLRRPLLAALCAAFLFAFAGLEALERAVYLPEQLPGLVFGAERVVFGVISGFDNSEILGVATKSQDKVGICLLKESNLHVHRVPQYFTDRIVSISVVRSIGHILCKSKDQLA
ncbi:hypothetical protein EYF80_037145 [Liparis tanakae]|uniref:Uncharacterized protein n=1 Tax=Liparis tanakae TaxID=230148 RepID=A0A4Z2GHK1_9TELE|nr:hypothetical protein EYF80_037145 [Liparis tanakae]